MANMQALRLVFERATQGTEPEMLQSPGVGGLCVLLNSESFVVEEEKVQEMFSAKGWEETQSFTWEELVQTLEVKMLPTIETGTAQNEDMEECLGEHEHNDDDLGFQSPEVGKLADLIEKSLSERSLRHRIQDGVFIPLLPLASIRDEEMQAVAARTVPLVEERHLPHIEASLWHCLLYTSPSPRDPL